MEAHKVKLTSSEYSSLWANYIGDSMSICIFTFFLSHIEDVEIKPIVEHALSISKQHLNIISKIFEAEGIPVPRGFTSEDVNTQAPRLFEDTFYLQYIKHVTKGSLATYSAVLPNVFRQDIRHYFISCLTSTMELYDKATDLLLSKGLEVRSPYIPYQQQVEFVEKQSFLSGWLGEQRPLSGLEITHLYANIQTNKLGQSLSLAFAQSAKQKEVKEYMLRGIEITKKHIDSFSNLLKTNYLPVPMTSDEMVSESTIAPFSDKLMMYHIGLLSATGMGNYGLALSLSPRKDLAAMYVKYIAETGLYAEDGANINIKHNWMERPPQAVNRDQLTK
ncbi:DUF3231 family protein [Bacillus pinisoli]|uniref:DUF3231 family protein n=1 Tax=Bacillus pinisoli TaxID=2901866 RepID=UPI001FF6D809|nr:DUF3231 family protein [Bacillus pinisoli]